MAQNDHRFVNLWREPLQRTITFGHVSILFAISALVCIGVLLSGEVNAAAITIFVSYPLLVLAAFGRGLAGPAIISSLVGMAILIVLQMTGAMPPAIPIYSTVLNWAALALVASTLTCAATSILLARRAATMTSDTPLPDVQRLELPTDGNLLVIQTTPLGRVSDLTGHTDWVPGLGKGAVLDRAVRSADGEALRSGRFTLSGGVQVNISRTVTDSGEQWVLASADPKGDADDALAELAARTTFFAELGHDLKSPLNSVIGFAEVMDDEILGPMPEAYRDYPGMIREGGRTLLRLVEDMLNYARSEAGTFEIDPAPVDITSIGESVLRQSEASAQRADVTLQFKTGGAVMAHADASAVYRIWDNLVSNAIKYSEEGGLVRLSARAQNGVVKLSVTDHGAGMDADDLAQITKPFQQGRNAKGRAGSGLGLAMVQRLAEMHGGQVVIRTELGEGTHVVVTLPAAEVVKERDAAE